MMIDIVFNSINFLIFLGLATYAFFVYVKPIGLKALLSEREEKCAREEVYKDLLIITEELKNKAEEDQKFFIYLQQKVTLWQEKKALLVQDKIVKQVALQQKIDKNAEQKTRDSMLFMAQKTAFESAYIKVEKELTDSFKDHQQQELYLDTLVAKLVSDDR